MAMKEPTYRQVVDALDCSVRHWREFGDGLIDVLKQYPFLSKYLKPLIETYKEACADMQEKTDSWPEAYSQKKQDI